MYSWIQWMKRGKGRERNKVTHWKNKILDQLFDYDALLELKLWEYCSEIGLLLIIAGKQSE